MYLDDGISMNSEPLSEVPGLGSGGRDRERMTLGADKYCKVVLEQVIPPLSLTPLPS